MYPEVKVKIMTTITSKIDSGSAATKENEQEH
jgi:hypothetical protein